MTTRLYTHDACLEHDTGPGHPERSDRLRAVRAALGADDFAGIERAEAPAARAEDLARCHPDGYVEQIFELAPSDHAIRLDPDTVMSPDSLEASLRAAGAVIAGIDAVVGGEVENAFCATRPPGHHAEPGRPMGFCIFNSVVVGALHARAAHGVQRIAVVDFDVHHGNGTEAAFREDGDLAYVSSHQYPYYPGTGAATDTGVGNIHNAPLPAGSGSAEFRVAYADRLLPALDAFAPELVLISAGFDAHARDPLAGLNLQEDDYAWITGELRDIALRHAGGRLVSTLEGGYDLEALAASSAVHVATLMA